MVGNESDITNTKIETEIGSNNKSKKIIKNLSSKTIIKSKYEKNRKFTKKIVKTQNHENIDWIHNLYWYYDTLFFSE